MISELLGIGLKNATPAKDLASLLNVRLRTVTALVETERLQGLPICASHKDGYYLAANDEELELYLTSLRGKSLSEAKVIEALQEIKRSGKVHSSVSELIKSKGAQYGR